MDHDEMDVDIQRPLLNPEDSAPSDENFLHGLTGLWNLGNTCYMNSALQALSNCPQFREYFRSFLADDPEFVQDGNVFAAQDPHPISSALVELMGRLWADNSNNPVGPSLLLMKVREKCPQFRSFTQQDSQEFIRCLLDALHQELRRPVKKWEVDFMETCRSGSSIDSGADISDGPSDGGDGAIDDGAHHSQPNVSSDNEQFETADSGLSSDTETSSAYNGDRNESHAREQIVRYRSIISDVFDGELVSSVKCQTCHHISYTTENFQDISLSIPISGQLDYRREPPSFLSLKATTSCSPPSPSSSSAAGGGAVAQPKTTTTQLLRTNYGYIYWLLTFATRWLLGPWMGFFKNFYRYWFSSPVTLEHCLKTFFSMDYLHGDDMYSCERCAKLRNGVKQCALTELPEILCIHLKRFRHDNMYNSKVNTRVHFPLTDLDLRPFMRESARERGERVTQYDLVAIVSHRGGSVDHGHYVAYCRNDVDKNWYEFDDRRVTRVNGLDVMNREAYMLFYQKKTPTELVESRQHILSHLPDQIEADVGSVNVDRYYVSKEWLYRFMIFAEPGHVNNCDFLCSHGHLMPNGGASPQRLVQYLTGDMWALICQQTAGGGPECRRLIECGKCRRVYDRLMKRKLYERIIFEELELDPSHGNDVIRFPPNVISSHWLDKWNAFVQQPNTEPPPPINNEALVKRYKDGIRLRNGSRYVKIRRQSWLFFHGIYGGGPELLAMPFVQLSSEEITEHIERLVAERESQLRLAALRHQYELESAADDERNEAVKEEFLESSASGDTNVETLKKKTYKEAEEDLKITDEKTQKEFDDDEKVLEEKSDQDVDLKRPMYLLPPDEDVPINQSESSEIGDKSNRPDKTTDPASPPPTTTVGDGKAEEEVDSQQNSREQDVDLGGASHLNDQRLGVLLI